MRDKVFDKEMEVIHLTLMSHLRYCWYCINATQVVTVCKRSLRRLCFYTCLSFCPPGGAGVSAPVGSPGPHLGGLQAHTWGVSRPTLGGVSRPTPGGGVSRPTPGGCIPACTEAAPHPTPTAVGGTHPTGMHSCLIMSTAQNRVRCRSRYISFKAESKLLKPKKFCISSSISTLNIFNVSTSKWTKIALTKFFVRVKNCIVVISIIFICQIMSIFLYLLSTVISSFNCNLNQKQTVLLAKNCLSGSRVSMVLSTASYFHWWAVLLIIYKVSQLIFLKNTLIIPIAFLL